MPPGRVLPPVKINKKKTLVLMTEDVDREIPFLVFGSPRIDV